MDTRDGTPPPGSPNWRARLPRPIRELGVYAAIELILPGGSLLALSLWLLRHHAWLGARARLTLAGIRALGRGRLFRR